MSASAALRERAALLGELGEIVQAMKNIAFAELQRIARVLGPQGQARDAVVQSLASIGGGEEPDVPSAPRPVLWLVIGAERGLCGAFNARLVQEIAAGRRADASARYLVAGGRLAELGADAAAVVQGCSGLEDMDSTLDAWVLRLQRERSQCREGWLLYTGGDGIVRERLWPWSAPAPAAASAAPGRFLPAAVLCDALRRQALRLSLQAGLCASLQQENRWRLAQMQRADEHLDELALALRRRVAARRQSDITNELETLMTSVDQPAAATLP